MAIHGASVASKQPVRGRGPLHLVRELWTLRTNRKSRDTFRIYKQFFVFKVRKRKLPNAGPGLGADLLHRDWHARLAARNLNFKFKLILNFEFKLSGSLTSSCAPRRLNAAGCRSLAATQVGGTTQNRNRSDKGI